MTHTTISINVGLQVRAHRKANALSQEVLATRCGIYRTYLSRIESGTANPSLQVLSTLAEVLGIDIKDLFAVPD